MPIERPKNLETVKIKISFNGSIFDCAEIDLAHVNKNGRSNFSACEVATMVKNMVNGKMLFPSDVKEFEDEVCSYFALTAPVEENNFRLVFCICSDRPSTIGVITLFRC